MLEEREDKPKSICCELAEDMNQGARPPRTWSFASQLQLKETQKGPPICFLKALPFIASLDTNDSVRLRPFVPSNLSHSWTWSTDVRQGNRG